MRATPIVANRVVALCSKMFSLADEWGLIPANSNPAAKIKKFKEIARERFLSTEELQRLGAALDDAAGAHPNVVAIIRLLLLTGARLSEISTLRWTFVDFERSCVRLPDSKTGAKVVRLGAPALAILSAMPRISEFVFPGRAVRSGRAAPISKSCIEHVWWNIRARAGVSDLRLHDLRHAYASAAAMGGMSLPMIGQLLGHRQASTTARYAHFAADPVQEAAEAISATLAAQLTGATPAQVIALPRSKIQRQRKS
jgi:integrase